MTDYSQLTIDDIPATPVLPYSGSSGWSGSETSRQRAAEADKSGATSARQASVLATLQAAGRDGMTWKEVADTTGGHHGSASGMLSNLHKAGIITRLTDTRHRCQIYVLPKYVDGRTEAPYLPNVSARVLVDILKDLDDDISHGRLVDARRRIHLALESWDR